MKKLHLMSACLILTALTVTAPLAILAQGHQPAMRPGELIVRFRPGTAPSTAFAQTMAAKSSVPGAQYAFTPATQLDTLNRPASLRALEHRFGLREGRPLGAGSSRPISTKLRSAKPSTKTLAETWLLRLAPDADLNQALTAWRQDPAVLFAEPNYQGTLTRIPSDPLYSQQRADFSLIGMERAWDIRAAASAGVEVAVIDSGIDAQHPDLKAALDFSNSYNFPEHNSNIFDDLGHGTRVAGVIGAVSGNGEGISGVAPGCRLMSLDVVDSSGTITVADVASAIDWATAHGADVINISLAFHARSQTLDDACAAALAAGAVMVAAAGNENQGELAVYPACCDGVIGVGAVTADGQRCSWSNYNGTCPTLVDLVAPGETVFSTIPNGQYNGSYGSGTSFAAPMVSGVAALLKTRYWLQSGSAIAAHLLATATPAGAQFQPADGAGAGILNAQRALETAMQPNLALDTVTVDDAVTSTLTNDANGRLGRGEKARLLVRLKNTGADIDLIDATLATADPNITIGKNTAHWDAIKHGDAAEPGDPFAEIAISPTAAAYQTTFTLSLAIRANGSAGPNQTLTLTLPVEASHTVATGNYFTLQTWTADQTYEILGSQNFNAGLKIEPGTIIKLTPDANLYVNGGTLTANGTADRPILLTARQPRAATASQGDTGPKTVPVNLGQYAGVRYVSIGSGSDATGDGSAQKPWASIPYALNKITNASVASPYALLVAEGRYAGATINMKSGVDLFGGYEPGAWTRDIQTHMSILDGEMARRVVAGANSATIDGFKITNGYVVGDGGGISCSAVTPTISNNYIVNNSAKVGSGGGWCSGGGISCRATAPVIINNLIMGNTVGVGTGGGFAEGGGIGCGSASPTIKNNIIIGNSAYENGGFGWGGGISCDYSASPTISNNLIISNRGESYGGGISCMYSSAPVVTNNLFIGNLSNRYGAGISCNYASSPTILNNTFSKNAPAGLGVHGNGDPCVPVANNCIFYNDASSEIYNDSSLSVTSCDVQGGFAGANNINADPRFIGLSDYGLIVQAQYDAATGQSCLSVSTPTLVPGALQGKVICIGSTYYPVIANTASTITVLGNAAMAGALPLTWTLFDYHLKADSPCIDSGTNTGALTTDLEGTARPINGGHSLTVDMGAYEFNPSAFTSSGAWGQLYLKNSASGSSMRYCTVEASHGVLNESSTSSFVHCNFQDNMGWGFSSTAANTTITSCTAAGNYSGGISAPGQNLTGCIANSNMGPGLIGAALLNCSASTNVGTGLNGSSATNCQATFNNGVGISVSGLVLNCLATLNSVNGINGNVKQSQSIRNGGIGISGTADTCNVIGNGSGGISGSAADCQVIGNTGYGISGSATLTRCLIRDNSGAAAVGASTVDTCTITGNGSGPSVGTAISNSYVANNGGQGVSGGAVRNSTIIGNQGQGLLSPASVSASWVMFNKGVGIESPLGNIDSSSICYNGGYGIFKPASGKLVNHCNLYGNAAYEAYDNLNNAASGYPGNTKDFRHNYWGPLVTPQLVANPFPSVNIAGIYDLFDHGSSNGWYINYGGAGEFETAPLANAPGDQAPAFLITAQPDAAHPLNIGVGVFTLTFSRAMNTGLPLSVTFGQAAPYTTSVVLPSPGWVNSTSWQGTYAVQSGETNGPRTLCVAGAVDSTGFAIPDDTAHSFVIETTGVTAANSGQASGQGTGMTLFWAEKGKPATALGYSIMRSKTGAPGSYSKINSALLTRPAFEDTGLSPKTTYYYIVYLVDNGMNATQWTPPFSGQTGASVLPKNAVHGWHQYH